jgi:3-hydroxyacyl-CoA dehydrogenase
MRGIAVIRLDNPPVNGLSQRVRSQVGRELDAALNDPAVSSIVIIGAGKMFSGGADIREFNTPAAAEKPTLRDLIATIEASPKSVIAAIHGSAFGGGLELALACKGRVASGDAKLALPEVKLGLLPGAGGTQRLPRLVGVKEALAMIVSGDPVGARKAKEIGLVDEIIEGDLLEGAKAFAKTTPAKAGAQLGPGLRRDDALFEAARAEAARTKRNQVAPLECIACVEAATRLTLEEGLKFERERFEKLMAGEQSKALRHIFFAEREAAKVADLPPDTKTRRLERVAVIGAGTMGGGISMSFANADIPVTMVEMKEAALERGLATIRKNYAATVSKGKLTQLAMDTRLELIRGTLDLNEIGAADLVIEAVFEEMDVKKDVFRRLDAIAKHGAILATNTSRLDVDEIAAMTRRPQDVLGMHFFSPANVMRLLEVVRAEKTAPDVLATAMQAGRRLGKIPVLARVCEGFIGNRMLSPYLREANFLLEEGATPQQVDRALQEFGLAMGPFAVCDLAGLDIGWEARKRLAPARPKGVRYSCIPDRICEMGRFGQKTGRGYYRYEPGSRTPIPDPEIEALIVDCASEARIVRRQIGNEEIVDRTMLALVNEGARILEEGIAQRASDIDVIYVYGYGFPAWRGGPMFWADTRGLDKVLARIREFEKMNPDHWKPAPILERLGREGGRFNP